MALFLSFLWLNNIPLYINTREQYIFHILVCVCMYIYIHTHPLYPFLCQWTFGLPPRLGYCKSCCNEQWGACLLLNYSFVQLYAPEWDCGSCVSQHNSWPTCHNAEIIYSALCSPCTRSSLVQVLFLESSASGLMRGSLWRTRLVLQLTFQNIPSIGHIFSSQVPNDSCPSPSLLSRISKPPLSLWVDTESLSLNMPFANRFEGWV